MTKPLILVVANVEPDSPDAEHFPRLLTRLRQLGTRVTVVRTPREVAMWEDPPDGIVLSGGPGMLTNRVCFKKVAVNVAALEKWPETPALGICFGMQLMVQLYGGSLRRMRQRWRQCRDIEIQTCRDCHYPLMDGIDTTVPMQFAFQDACEEIPPGFSVSAWATHGTSRVPVAIAEHGRNRIAVQFHPESSGQAGKQLLQNFINICQRAREREVERIVERYSHLE